MVKTAKEQKESMQQFVEELGTDLMPLKEGSIIEVTILAKSRNRILVDVSGLTEGVILDKEFSIDVNDLKPGDKVLAYVLAPENHEGFAVLSLKRADKERFNQRVSKKFEDQENVKVRISQANKGGLIGEYGGLEGFLPVSQLSSEHYPKVGDDKNKILEKLQKFIGQDFNVKIINYDKEQNKLIFSEKAAQTDEIKDTINNFKIGQTVDGVVSGIVDFGLFVDLGKIEGLAHISEVSWDRIKDLKQMYKIGDKIKVQIISIDDNKISLSIKRLLPDPWLDKVKKLKVNDTIEGEVERITPFGVFVKLPEQINGLVHISELSDMLQDGVEMDEVLSIGKTYKFEIISIEPQSHKISLKLLVDTKEKESKKKNTKKEKKSAE